MNFWDKTITQAENMAEGRPARFFSASALAGLPVPEREWHIDGLLPSKTCPRTRT